MEEDFCFTRSTTNILTAPTAAGDRPRLRKKSKHTGGQPVTDDIQNDSHTNQAFEAEYDFVLVDKRDILTDSVVTKKVGKSLLENQRSEADEVHTGNTFIKEMNSNIQDFEFIQMDSSSTMIGDRVSIEKTNEHLEIKVVDPYCSCDRPTKPVTKTSHLINKFHRSLEKTYDKVVSRNIIIPRKHSKDESETFTSKVPFRRVNKDDVNPLPTRLLLHPSHLPHSNLDLEDGHYERRTQNNSRPLVKTQSLRVSSAGRTQSMNDVPRLLDIVKHSGGSRKLLRELSFSDADSKTTQNYGTLKNAQALPRRKPQKQQSLAITESVPSSIPHEMISPLVKLMQELIGRGKVKQVAVLDQANGHMVTSIPPWRLSESDTLSLVKAVTYTQQIMLKLTIDGQIYSCFKHGHNKMVARTGDHVLVAQQTQSSVVVARALGGTPGSCLQEVAEFADVLFDKGW